MSDGLGTGMIELAAKMPAFPCEAPVAGPFWSIIVTLKPLLWSQIAVETPTMPAPITIIVFIWWFYLDLKKIYFIKTLIQIFQLSRLKNLLL